MKVSTFKKLWVLPAAVLAFIALFGWQSVFADAGNPILGTIHGTLATNGDGTVTVTVRGQWNWLSHNSDCNFNRAATGVGIIWNDPTEPGFTVTKGSLSAGVGIASLRPGDAVNTVDKMVHPVDRGNLYSDTTPADPNAPQPGPAGQAFVDPSPPNPASYLSWKGGCGREPISAPCGINSDAVADPCGSWGYEKNGGLGYAHTFASRSDVSTVCANFYDVHGGGTGTKFQLVNGAKEITVNGNGDNSIQTNAFNPAQGANCISFPECVISPFKTADAKNVDYGSDVGFTVGADTLAGKGDCAHLTLTDPLPGSSGLHWFEDPDVAACAITGPDGSQVLDCDFGAVPAGSHVEVHVRSHTDKTTAACPGTRTLLNTVTLHDPNQSTTTDPTASADIKVHCPSTTLEKGVAAASDVQITANYTYKEANNGDVALGSVAVTDDQCSPVTYVSGDTNGNGKLDTTETWVFNCSHTYTLTSNPQDFTNTAIGSGTSPLGHVVTFCGTSPAAGRICNDDETDSTTIHVEITVGGP